MIGSTSVHLLLLRMVTEGIFAECVISPPLGSRCSEYWDPTAAIGEQETSLSFSPPALPCCVIELWNDCIMVHRAHFPKLPWPTYLVNFHYSLGSPQKCISDASPICCEPRANKRFHPTEGEKKKKLVPQSRCSLRCRQPSAPEEASDELLTVH